MCIVSALLAMQGCGRGSVRHASDALVRFESPWSGGGVSGRLYVTPRVRLFTNISSRSLRTRLPLVLEYTISGFSRFWPGPLPDVELEVVVYDSLESWRGAVHDRFGVEPGEGLERGAATARGVSLLHDIGEDATLILAAHEVWHAYAQRVLVHPLPVALDEAIACAAEGMRWEGAAPTLSYTSNPARAAHLRRLIDERRLGTLAMHMEHGPVELSGDAALLDDYYARAWCLGIMLLDSDQVAVERGLKRLIADARVGQRTVEATGSGREMLEQLGSRYFERHPEDMEDLWQRTARRLAGG
ncbi:MAG: hypothetical protein DYG94_09810 [Leptolyngbya sp. PLA3]|nr:MAG: hypothetical protein EDM82_07885 [Cyanobacteria bacterium CYA]MCE7969025.1 hypothetical protein [Leptolyngbya sp. PL-A3]